MGKKIRIAGLDPSLSNFGISVGTLDIETNKVDIEKFYLVETSAGGSKKQVRVNSDDLRRANEIWRNLKPVIDDAQLILPSCQWAASRQEPRRHTAFALAYWLASTSHSFS